ncbi:hypothetical protein [Vibrio vulnificus]|nr:hypothetical protein [Vibrio vulnificus]
MKLKLLTAVFATTALLSGCGGNEVGDVGLGWFTLNDLHSITQPF